jgi:hypothetical protein
MVLASYKTLLCQPTVSAIRFWIFYFDEWLFKSKATLTPLIQPISKLENFEDQILEKKNNFDNTKRETLVAVLQNKRWNFRFDPTKYWSFE